MINQIIQRYRHAGSFVPHTGIIHIRHHPVGSVFGTDNPEVVTGPVKHPGTVFHTFRPGQGMFGIKIFSGRYISHHIEENTVGFDPVFHDQVIVLHHMSHSKTGIQVCIIPTCPIVHKSHTALFPVFFKTGPRKNQRPAAGFFFMNGKLCVKGMSIAIIVPVLIIIHTGISQLVTGLHISFVTFPSACFRCRRQRIRVSHIISSGSPATHHHMNIVNAKGFQLSQLCRQLFKGHHAYTLVPCRSFVLTFIHIIRKSRDGCKSTGL